MWEESSLPSQSPLILHPRLNGVEDIFWLNLIIWIWLLLVLIFGFIIIIIIIIIIIVIIIVNLRKVT